MKTDMVSMRNVVIVVMNSSILLFKKSAKKYLKVT